MADFYLDQKTGTPVVLPTIGPWIQYVPSASQGFGTIASSELYYREDGEDLLIEGRFTPGTVANIEAQLALPAGYTCGTQRGTGITNEIGEWKVNSTVTPLDKAGTVLSSSGRNYVTFSVHDRNVAMSPVIGQAASAVFGSNIAIYIRARVPCAQLAGGMRAYGAGLASVSGTTEKSGLIRPRKGQVTLPLTSAATGFSIVRAVGIYYQDQDGNHRLKFNFSFLVTSLSRANVVASITGTVFKNVANYAQPVSVVLDGTANSANGYVSPGTGNITLYHATGNTTGYHASGDVELESKPTWA